MRRAVLIASAALALALAAPVEGAGAVRVVGVSGEAEFRAPGREWRALKTGTLLPKGSDVRTGEAGGARLAFDARLDHVAELGSDARLALRGGAGGPLVLEKGRMQLLRESEGPVFVVMAGDLRAYVETGGLTFEASRDGSWIGVFGGRVRVGRGQARSLVPVDEGHGLASSDDAPRRMTYAEYSKWLSWVKAWYETKDKIDERVLELEYGLKPS